MPPALDRLLASPSALRLLRSIIESPELPLRRLNRVPCCHSTRPRLNYSTDTTVPIRRVWNRRSNTNKDGLGSEESQRSPQARLPHPEHRGENVPFEEWTYSDASSWARHLSYTKRVQGKRGVRRSWKWCRSMNHPLPTEDTPDVTFIWSAYLEDSKLVLEIIEHAAQLLRDTGRVFPRLYRLLLCYWLPRNASAALGYHDLLLQKLNQRRIPLKEIISSLHSRFHSQSWIVLMHLYRASDERDVYDDIIPHLIERGELSIAHSWHHLCIQHYDRPSEATSSHPIVRVFMAEQPVFDEQQESSKDSSQLRHHYEKSRVYNEELLKRLAGRDTAPVRFDDTFCARLFATQTFPPTSLIRGLAMVGVNEIGPLAIQSMALRADSIQELPGYFQELRDNGIALQGCVFSLALEKFALEHKWDLVQSLLNSDQHPDVYNDTEIQRKLLKFYVEQHDRPQVQRTLAILSLFHRDPDQQSYNLLLQMHISTGNLQEIVGVLNDMRSRGIMITPESVFALRGMLKPRQRGHRPAHSKVRKYDDLRFVSRISMCILESGIGHLTPRYWHEIIRRFGMSGRLGELRRLLLWLLCWYAPQGTKQYSNVPEPPLRKAATQRLQAAYPEHQHLLYLVAGINPRKDERHPIRQLFPPPLLNALIIWGFRAGLLPNATMEQSLLNSKFDKKHYRKKLMEEASLQRKQWSIGLETVVQLRDLGVCVHTKTVAKALQQQLRVLFGAGRSDVVENRTMRGTNRLSYATYVRHINRIWGSDLIEEPLSNSKTGHIRYRDWHPEMTRDSDGTSTIALISRKATLDKQGHALGDGSNNPKHQNGSQITKDTVADLDSSLQQLKQRFEMQAKAIEPSFRFLDDRLFEEMDATTKTLENIDGRLQHLKQRCNVHTEVEGTTDPNSFMDSIVGIEKQQKKRN